MISPETVEELKTVIKEEYGRELETEEVRKIIEDTTGFFNLLAKIYHRMKSQS